jgi:pyruvate carboxylase
VARGEALVAIEAMKMETHVIAEREATVTQVHVKPGDTVSPGDLLVSVTFAYPSARAAA